MNINSICVSARLASDPETVAVSSTSVTTLRCVTNNYAGKEKGEVPVFFDVKVWGKIGETCQSLSKGELVFIQGRLDMDTWEKDGSKFSKLYITASSVIFGSSPKSEKPTAKTEKPKGQKQPTSNDDDLPF